MTGGLRVDVDGGQELRELSRALRRHADGKALTKRLRTEMRGVAKPLVPAIRRNIKSMPSKGESRRRGRRKLRTELSRSLTLQVRTSGRSAGVAVFMSPKKMPDGKKALPSYLERRPGYMRLRHPVFGDPDLWVQQRVPPAGYFTRAVGPAERNAQQRIRAVVDAIANEIED